MNWSNPDPFGYKYWYTLWLAASERLSALPQLSLSYTLTNPPPYSVNMLRSWISQFILSIEQIAHYYVDLNYCFDNPPTELFNTYIANNVLTSANKIFPYVFNYNRLIALYPNFQRFTQSYLINSIYADVTEWQLKQIMLDIYDLLNKMVYTCGYVKGRCLVVSASEKSLYADDNLTDLVQSFKDTFQYEYDNNNYISYSNVSYNGIGYGDANDQRCRGGVTVGAVAWAQYKDNEQISYGYIARPYIIKNFAVQVLKDKLPNLIQLTYVPTLDLVENNTANINTYGYSIGLSKKDLGEYNGFRNIQIVSAEQIQFPDRGDIPSVEWDGYFPKQSKYLLNGCRMSVALLLDYRYSFLFSNHQLDDSSNSD